jgi:hypothetical protein
MTKKQVKWAISTAAFEKPGFPKLTDALEAANIDYFQSTYSNGKYEPVPYNEDECVVLYGPIQFVRANTKTFIPGAFGFKNQTYTSFYMSQLPSNLFFNHDAVFLPFGMIAEKKDQLKGLFGKHLFIRPDSGFKTFTGFHVKIDDIDAELSSTLQISNPSPHEMCLIAKAKSILGEYRFVVCNGEVITGSQYRWDGKLDVRIDVHDEAWKFADKYVAKANWQLDSCYVVDIFLGEDGPKIGEFNSFASSGLYNCDLNRIVKEVSALAAKEMFY